MLIFLDVILGVSFIYLILALACSAFMEMYAQFVRLRASVLRRTIHRMFGDDRSEGAALTAHHFYQHALILTLGETPIFNVKWLPFLTWPSYIKPETFAAVLLDLMPRTEEGNPDLEKGGFANQDILRLFWDESSHNPVLFRKKIETWYQDTMERSTGWYKRRVQVRLLVIAGVLCILGNIDTIHITKTLWQSPELRAEMVAMAENYEQYADAVNRLESDKAENENLEQALAAKDQGEKYISILKEDGLNLPIGWENEIRKLDPEKFENTEPSVGDYMQYVFNPRNKGLLYSPEKWVGIFVSIIAVSMGAPFWFELVGKLVSLRSAGKKPA